MSKPTPEVQKRYDQSPKGKYRSYKDAARRRGIEFKLTLDEFAAFWRIPCYYCGYEIKTVGVDRVCNEKGYIPGNVTACCQWCNAAKSNLTQAHFFDLCRQVVVTHGLLEPAGLGLGPPPQHP